MNNAPPARLFIPSAAEDGNARRVTMTTPESSAPDPFDPARLRLSQNLAAALGVKKHLTTVPVRRPSKEWFVRCHPDATYQLETYVLDLKEDSETYLVTPDLWDSLAGESTFSAKLLVTAINRQGTVFVWPIRLPSPDGRHDEWSRSAMEAANIAKRGWVRVQASMNLGAYEVYEAGGNLSDPEWPTLPLNQLLRIAFKDRYIDSLDHPVLKRLRGES
jgi:hypothetical protein